MAKQSGGKRKTAGRPRIEVDWSTVNKLLAIHCTAEEIAGYLEISADTLSRACQREHKMDFAEYSAEKRQAGKISLRRRQFQAAESGNITMLIWLGKQWLGQADKSEQWIESKTKLEIEGMADEAKAKITKLLAAPSSRKAGSRSKKGS